MSWKRTETKLIPPRFSSHAQSLGVNLLTDDMLFIEKMLSRVPQVDLRRTLQTYLDVWCEKLKESHGLTAENQARRAANSWLRTTF